MNNKYKAILMGFGGLVLGVLLTLMAFRFWPRLQVRVAHGPQVSRQMQVWNDFNQTQRQMLEHFDQMFKGGFEDDFFNSKDPFEGFSGMKSDSSGVGELTQREDDHYVYYDMSVEDLKSTAIQSKIENGYLTVSGTVEKKNVEEGVEKSYKTQFQRTFPLPDNVDTKKMEVVSHGHTVTFKFPKV